MSNWFDINHGKSNKPVIIIWFLFIVFALMIISKLLWLQVIEKKDLTQKAHRMRQDKAVSYVMRGEILDRNGVKLVANKTVFDVYVDPRCFEEDQTPHSIASMLAPILGKSASDLEKELADTKYTVIIAKNVEKETVEQLRKLKLKSLDIRKKSARVYPQGTLAAHILGYVNVEADISAGIEKTAQDDLKKLPEYEYIETTPDGNVIYDFNTNPAIASKPLKGEDITLTIDSAVQHIAEVELNKMIKETKADKGSVVVMNPKNGEILAFVVLPSYNPPSYKKLPPQLIKNWALSDVYSPGSVFKMLTVSSAMELGYIHPNSLISDTGKITIQGSTIKNYDYNRHPNPGMINLEYLFEHSSNVGSVNIALMMKPEEFYNMLKKFGIGSKTNVDLPGESPGLLPHWTRWQKLDQANIGFGYSVNVTPIQLASAVSAIANNGVRVTPHIIKYSSQEEYDKHVISTQVLSPQTAQAITSLLTQSIAKSKAVAGKIPNYTVAGKTGTSNRPNANGIGYNRHEVYTTFAGFFPASDPEILVVVFVDNPKSGVDWGSTIAGPVFNEIAVQISRIMDIKPDKKEPEKIESERNS